MTTNRRALSFIAVLILTIAACSTGVPSPSAAPGTGLAISAVAGPTCPVETIPPDPACAPRPVPGATVIILDGQGKSVATVVLDTQGAAIVTLPAGNYVVQPQPAEGLMGTAESMNVAVVNGTLTPVVLSYDTGIR
jgi:hypothetical protein